MDPSSSCQWWPMKVQSSRGQVGKTMLLIAGVSFQKGGVKPLGRSATGTSAAWKSSVSHSSHPSRRESGTDSGSWERRTRQPASKDSAGCASTQRWQVSHKHTRFDGALMRGSCFDPPMPRGRR